MTFALRVLNWVARKIGVQITLAGRPIGMSDNEFVATWEKVRARGLSRYSIRRAAVATAIFVLVWIFVGMVRAAATSAERIDGTTLLYVPLCFVVVALLAAIRWSRHEDRFLRLTAPWVVKRFD